MFRVMATSNCTHTFAEIVPAYLIYSFLFLRYAFVLFDVYSKVQPLGADRLPEEIAISPKKIEIMLDCAAVRSD